MISYRRLAAAVVIMKNKRGAEAFDMLWEEPLGRRGDGLVAITDKWCYALKACRRAARLGRVWERGARSCESSARP